jgi:hypothetical protein
LIALTNTLTETLMLAVPVFASHIADARKAVELRPSRGEQPCLRRAMPGSTLTNR